MIELDRGAEREAEWLSKKLLTAKIAKKCREGR